jgi:uncharacterized protein
VRPHEKPRAVRIAAGILTAVAVIEAIPIVFSIRGLDRALLHSQSLWAVLGAVAITAGFVAYSARNAAIRARIGTFGWITIPAVLVAVIAGIVEEVYFRKVLMDALAAGGVGVAVQIAVSGLAFGALHAFWGIGGGWRVACGAIFATTLLGIALAVLYAADGRVLAPCIYAHIAIDLVLEPALVLSAVDAALRRRAVRA